MREHVRELEKRLGFGLPVAYREFLVAHDDSLLATPRLFTPPRSGVIDSLFTAERILKNDAEERIGILEKGMLHIGGNLLGGCLYLKISEEAFGGIYYAENYVFREHFPSFSAFLNETQPECA